MVELREEKTMKKDSEIWLNLQRFANEHKLILEDKGEVGFGRECVGFLGKNNSYIDFNPIRMSDLKWIWEYDIRLFSPESVKDAYHKDNCLAVLVNDGDYDRALEQLNEWVKHLEAQGEVYIESYKTEAKGLQIITSGVIGYAVRIRGGEIARG